MGMFSDIDYSLIVLQLEKAMANGVATLDSNTKVPKAQISLTASDVGAIASTGNEVLTSLNAASGTISSGLLPSYVDDVLSYTNLAGFPGTGETGKIYVDETTNKVYRWSGSVYVEISSSATAGEALKLTTPRTIATTGDASYSVSFDGSANVSAAITLATVNSNAGSFGSASSIPAITVNAKGQVTAVSTNSIGNELIALQSLSDTPGFLKKTGNGIYSIDINSYLSLAGGTITGDLVSTSATVSTSPTTGAIRGASLGITGAIFAGGNIGAASFSLANGNFSISNTTGNRTNLTLGNVNNSEYGASSIEIPTNTVYGGGFDHHTGIRLTSGGHVGWGTAQFQVSIGSDWKQYSAVPCFTAGNGQATVSNGHNNSYAKYQSHAIELGINSDHSFIDFHSNSSSTATDFEARLYCMGYTGSFAGGTLVLSSATFEIDSFTALGTRATGHPAIKIKQLTGTTAATQGGVVSIAHGVTASKIISVSALVEYSTSDYVTNAHLFSAGYYFDVWINSGIINVGNHPTSSAAILSKPVKITVIYTA